MKPERLNEVLEAISTIGSASGATTYEDVFIEAVVWADEHPADAPKQQDSANMEQVKKWFSDSFNDITKPTWLPTWSDKHLEKLLEDFYLIPKKQ